MKVKYANLHFNVPSRLISEIKVNFTAIPSDMGFLTSEVACDGRFIHAFNWVFPCQILYNPLISVSSKVYFRNLAQKNYKSTNF